MKKYTNAQRKKIRYFLMVIIATSMVSVIVITLFVGIVKMLHPGEGEEVNKLDYTAIEVAKPVISDMQLTVNNNSRPGIALKKINGIVIHYTANPGTDAKANRNYFESRKDYPEEAQYKVSSHYIVGLDGTIVQCIPNNEIAYASNKRNSDTLSIECCHPDKSGKFTENTYQSLIHLVAYLCDKYELSDNDIIRHYDVTKKMCPKYYVEYPSKWDALKNDVILYMENSRQPQIK